MIKIRSRITAEKWKGREAFHHNISIASFLFSLVYFNSISLSVLPSKTENQHCHMSTIWNIDSLSKSVHLVNFSGFWCFDCFAARALSAHLLHGCQTLPILNRGCETKVTHMVALTFYPILALIGALYVMASKTAPQPCFNVRWLIL